MKKGLLVFFALLACIAVTIIRKENNLRLVKEKSNTLKESGENENGARAEMIAARLQYEYALLKDPQTGLIPANIHTREMALARTLPLAGSYTPSRIITNGINTPTNNTYQLGGPNNIGGRTRTLAFDKRYNGSTNRVMIAGCVSGGIMRSADGGNSWTLVTPDQQIHSITTVAQDTRAGFEDTWYAGTGESLGNTASGTGAFFLGHGIYKSVNNGLTWSALPATQSGSLTGFDNAFDLVHRIAVNPANGDVYAACQSSIQRSQNGGTTWSVVKGNLAGNTITGNTDIVINSNGSKLYCAFHLKNATERGVWQSSTGNSGSWVLLGGNVDGTPAGWVVNTSTSTSVNWGRILMQVAPSNDNILYVMYENGKSQASPTFLPEADLFKLDVTGGAVNWTNLSANMPDIPGNNKEGIDPLAVQGGYDMLLSIKPDDINTVLVGGTNLYRSTSGFSNTTATSWIGGYATDFTTRLYPNSHPDMHLLAFDPTNPKRAFSCNDGGMQVTEDISAASVSWTFINNYQTLQYFSVAIDPEPGRNNFSGGAQDNGTWYRDATLNFGARPASRPGVNDFINLFGGDGVSVDIAKISGGKQLTYFGAQFGVIVRDELLDNANFPGASIRPKITELTSNDDGGYGEFVTNFKLSNANSEILLYVNYNKLFITKSASTVDSAKWLRLAGVDRVVNIDNNTSISIRGMDFSWGPYQTSHAMFFGTTNGKIFRLDDYANADAQALPKDITPAGLLGNVQDIAVNPNDDNEIMAVVSNYNTTSIWWTFNAKSGSPSWSNAEGNLTLPSIRSCAIVVKKDASNNPVTEYYVGTSVGLYSTESIGKVLGAGGTIVWSREGAGVLNFQVVTSLDYRPEDNTLLIGTHGNGMYFTTIGSPNFTPNLVTAIPAIINDKNFIHLFPTISKGVYQYTRGSVTGIKSISIAAFNFLGQQVYRQQVNYGSGSIPLTNVPAGTYVIQITSDNKKYQTIQKVIKL
jgi:hypothetical protein